MKRSGFTRSRIVAILRAHAAGATAPELCRKFGISEAVFYSWKANVGIVTPVAQRLKRLEDENRVLPKLLAETMLDNAALKQRISGHA